MPELAFVLYTLAGIGIIFVEPRRAVLLYLLIAQIDLSGPGFESYASVGFANAIKIVLLPLILLWRTSRISGWPSPKFTEWAPLAKAWSLLILYAFFSTWWSDYDLSGLKMVGYLCCSAVLAIVFISAWKHGWVTRKALILVGWSTIGLAVIQTYLLGNLFGTLENRFTSFSDPQGFAAFCLVLLALLLCGGSGGWAAWLTEGALVLSIVLAGSRYAFVSTILLFVIAIILRFFRRRRRLKLRLVLRRAAIGLLPGVLLIVIVVRYFPSSRIDELSSIMGSQEESIQDVGTLAWRFMVYQEALAQLSNRSSAKLFLGSGTSSGADVLLALGNRYQISLDPNRSMHNEFLRAFYEWGAIGFCLLLFVLSSMVLLAVRAWKVGWRWQAASFFAILPAMLFSLMIENVLANASGPMGVGYLLVCAGVFAVSPEMSSRMISRRNYASSAVSTSGPTAVTHKRGEHGPRQFRGSA
ncbi:MAG TPA: O-antigen ligase family protein [Candidatus Acidoferrales bacterium]|nr:O-antigen ligase family protein [Candidatus Acidoferrales bacterium]